MGLRTLYLRRHLSANGRESIAGRVLYDRFRRISDDCLLAHAVMCDEDASKIPQSLSEDLATEQLVRKLNPNLIYVEGGLILDQDEWRVHEPFARSFVEEGGVIIVADVDVNEARQNKLAYQAVKNFTGVLIDYGTHDSSSPVYGADRKHFSRSQRQIVMTPERMVISDWLRPIYQGLSEIMVSLPVHLAFADYDSVLASGNRGSTGTLQDDLWVDERDCCIYASVNGYGGGYVAFLGAGVSSDVFADRYPDNVKWLTNLGSFLVSESQSERQRARSHLKSPHCLFLSHRNSDAAFVADVAEDLKKSGLAVWLDKERLVPSVSLWGEISAGLDQMTHFVLFWSAACLDGTGVTREWRAAAAAMTERRIPIIIVRLDQTPVPAIMGDLYRIEAVGLGAGQVASRISDSVERLKAM